MGVGSGNDLADLKASSSAKFALDLLDLLDLSDLGDLGDLVLAESSTVALRRRGVQDSSLSPSLGVGFSFFFFLSFFFSDEFSPSSLTTASLCFTIDFAVVTFDFDLGFGE